ncbi:MAG: ABC transporter substrate-binding protein, partial [Gemmatimonadetes bacterium]|nr:ABC transporter substrate-binding protein [Gemmatimonadota bacterium]
VTPADEIAAARLISQTRAALEQGDDVGAAEAARTLVEEHPNVPGSAEGLWALAQAAFNLERFEEAAEAAAALAETIPADHAVAADGRALRAEALYGTGDLVASTQAYLSLPAEESTDLHRQRIAEAVRILDSVDLDSIASGVDGLQEDARSAPLLAEQALARALAGDSEAAQDLAERAASAGAEGRADSIVAAIRSGSVASLVPSDPVIGSLLPVTGSPTNQEYAALFMEGLEIAMEFAARDGRGVELAAEDNRGTLTGTERGIGTLESRGAVAVLGPLLDENVQAAATVREGRLTLFSPTARSLPSDTDAIYTMSAVDPGAARTLAETVASLGFSDAVVVHPRSAERTEEALAFEETFMSQGGLVLGRLEYEPGTTYFEEQLVQVDSLKPQLLVLPVPAPDVELLAPQVAFFGLDTLGIQVAGTSGWTSGNTLAALDQRFTDRVVAVSSSPPGLASDLTQQFVDAYEARFRRTLRSLVPATAFDMFRLLLAAYGSGVRTPGDFVHNMEGIRQFEGVTGTYSVVDGQIVRDFFPVRIYGGAVLDISEPLPEPPGP